jgi:pyruvate/2-oxoglutarate dehydrogenase complex dihydrolipoamide dehydrogenase (E3) component
MVPPALPKSPFVSGSGAMLMAFASFYNALGADEAAGFELKVDRFDFVLNGNPIALGAQQGMFKTDFDEKTDRSLGSHMVGPESYRTHSGFRPRHGNRGDRGRTDTRRLSAADPPKMTHECILEANGHVIHM